LISLDTNALIRYLVADDIEQAAAARSLIESLTVEHPGFICREVAVEMVWVLERAYRLTREQISGVVMELLATDSLVLEAPGDVARAASEYRRSAAGFSDLMILAAARRQRALPLHTFDRQLARMTGAVLTSEQAQAATDI
jgi:predicted nucleic-acid-binding protein